MKAKKVVSAKQALVSSSVQVVETPKINLNPIASKIAPIQDRNAMHLEQARLAILLQDSTKMGLYYLGGLDHSKPAFTELSWYEEQDKLTASIRKENEVKRRIALGLFQTSAPKAWIENAKSKDAFTKSLFTWLISLCYEFHKDDAYQVDIEDCMADLKQFNKNGEPASFEDKVRQFHITFSKAASILKPVYNQYTGELIKAGCPECAIQIERIHRENSYVVSFNIS